MRICQCIVFEHFGYDSSFLQHLPEIDQNPQLFNNDTMISLLQFKHSNFSVTEHYTNARKCQCQENSTCHLREKGLEDSIYMSLDYMTENSP